ncbi:MAG: hypothetical protein C4533_05240 [Candidatus Omnitrophota bacterium]|jgi:hypothetical protein|nr:MAG: hypothetical protein C4533_05240 [Candidatus Omnitrophota bacterium]
MQEIKKITDQVTEKLTMGQIERIWQQVDARKEDDTNQLRLQVFWFAGVEVWVVNEGGVITMMFPNEEV